MHNPVTVRYLISRQGNRNLVLADDATRPFDTLNEAKEAAWRESSGDHQNWFIHEVSVKTVYAYRPQPSKGEEVN